MSMGDDVCVDIPSSINIVVENLCLMIEEAELVAIPSWYWTCRRIETKDGHS